MEVILALDQGTTNCRALLIDRLGSIKAIAKKEFSQHFPKPDHVEHDALEIWKTQQEVIQTVLKYDYSIMGIGIANQRETTVIWDRSTSKPIYPAIVWQDRRTAAFCKTLKDKEMLFQSKTGLIIDPYFSGTKIKWILDNLPKAREYAEKGRLAFGTMDSWIIWNLTQGEIHITDPTNASRTLLFNIHTGKWDNELLDLLTIPPQILPEIKNSSEFYGYTKHPLFPKKIPLCGIAGDQQAALFGQACFQKADLKVTYGTGCFLLMHTGEKPKFSKHRLLTTIAIGMQGKLEYALEGSIFIGGALVQWLRDQLHLIKKSAEIEDLAKTVNDSHGVLCIPSFTGLGAPYWDPYAKGAFLGLTRGTTAGHIARSCLEGIAHEVLDILETLQKDTEEKISKIHVDGGASENDLLMQIQSDFSGSIILRPKEKEITALGAAFLAGLAVGFWKDKKEILKLWQLEKTFKPKEDPEKIKAARILWKKATKLIRDFHE